MTVSVILAAGRGTRIQSKDRNKVTLSFLNKPLIQYAVELFEGISDKTFVVIGAFHESVKDVLKNYSVEYVHQTDQLGTAHAVQAALNRIDEMGLDVEEILVSYGDHSMFYKKQTVQKLIDKHRAEKSNVSLITTEYPNPDLLSWGRILRDKKGNIQAIVEQKDATREQRKITEVNPGFYIFNTDFLRQTLPKVALSPISKEYYLTDLIHLAVFGDMDISSVKVPFDEVGIGINKMDELEESQKIYLERKAK